MKQVFLATFAWLATSSWSATAQTIAVDPYNGCRTDSEPVLITGIITPSNGDIAVFDHVGNDITTELALQFRLFRNTTTGEFSALLDGLSQSSLQSLTYTIRVTAMSQSAQEVIVFRWISAEITGPAIVPPCGGSVQMLLSPTTPTNGTFTGGTWITEEGIFNPAEGEGIYTVTYSGTYEGCDYTTTFDVQVTAATTGEFIFGVKSGYCANDDAVSGNVAPPGGDLTLNDDPVEYDAMTGEFSVPVESLPPGNNVLQYVIPGGCSETKDFTIAGPGTVVFSSTLPATACVGSLEPFFVLARIDGDDEQPLTTGFFTDDAATFDSVNGYYVLNTNRAPGSYASTYVYEYNFCTYTYDVTYSLLSIAPSPADSIRDAHYTCEDDWIQINRNPFTEGEFVLYDATTDAIIATSVLNPDDIRNIGGIFSIRKAILVPGTNYRLSVDPISGCYEDKTFGFEDSEGPSFGVMPVINAGCPASIPVSPAGGVLSYYVEGNLVPIIDNIFTAPAVGHYVLRYETACNYVEYIVEALGVEVSISGLLNAYYDNVTQVVMTGNPSGGVFSSEYGVTGNIFNPQAAGEGYHIITYTYQTAEGCILTATRGVQVVRVSCIAPSDLSALNITQNSALLTWNALVPNPTFYQVRYKKVGAGSENFVNVAGTVTSLSISGLMPNTTYQFRVRAFCNGAFTAFSPVFQFTTLADAPCTTPTIASAVVNANGSVTISWSPSVVGQLYEVEITYPDGQSGEVVSATGGSVTIPAGLEPGTYAVSVTAVCNPGLSAFTSFVIPDAPVCNPVSDLSAMLLGNLVVTFTPPSSGAEVSGYRVEIVGTGLETTVSSSPASLNVSSLDPGNYTVRVTTLCVGGGQSAPQTTSFEKPPVDCSAVPFISSISLTSNSATVRWGRLPNAIAYEVYYRSGSTTFPVITVPQTGSATQSRQITGLSPSTPYAVKVRAVCSGGVFSDFSAERRFTTLAGTGLREAVEWDGGSSLADVSVYPNPTKGISHWSFVSMEDGTANLAVYDMRGAVVANRMVSVYQGENQISLDLSDKAAGLYIVKLAFGESVHTVRLTLE